MSTVVELGLVPTVPTGEHQVDRNLLIELAPDREEQLTNRSIESIRDDLKISSQDESDDRKWLSIRFEQRKFKVSNVHSTATNTLSGSWVSLDKPSELRLSSDQICISPRPLGPTHTLVLYSDKPSPKGVYPKTVEMPIEALLFALHCPNLKFPQDTRVPPRRQDVMPRLLLRVRHLASFPALVVYMHTRDRMALFFSVLPLWITGVLQTLFSEKKTAVFNRVASELTGRATYDELVEAGSVVSGLRVNIQDIGLKELLLDAEVELVFRVLVKAITYKSIAKDDD